jgi:hypothetical protein
MVPNQQTATDAAIGGLTKFINSLIPDMIKDVIGKGKITDINKASSILKLNLYGVYSDNIQDTTMSHVKKALEAKYFSVVQHLITRIAIETRSDENLLDNIRQKLANGEQEDAKDGINARFDRLALAESVEEIIAGVMSKVVFNEQALGAQMTMLVEKKVPSAGQVAANDRLTHNDGSKFTPTQANDTIARTNAESTLKAALSHKHGDDNGSTFSMDIVIPAHGEHPASAYLLSFNVNVRMLNVEAAKVIEAVGTTRDRSNFFNYLKFRASGSYASFFKDFILNLKEIDKTVHRDMSANPADRMLNDMIRRGGTMVPEHFSDLFEAKHYFMIVEQSDADVLRTKHGFDLNKANALTLLFDKFNILSLVIVDTAKKSLRIYDSNSPLRSVIVSYGRDSQDDMASMFSTMLRR